MKAQPRKRYEHLRTCFGSCAWLLFNTLEDFLEDLVVSQFVYAIDKGELCVIYLKGSTQIRYGGLTELATLLGVPDIAIEDVVELVDGHERVMSHEVKDYRDAEYVEYVIVMSEPRLAVLDQGDPSISEALYLTIVQKLIEPSFRADEGDVLMYSRDLLGTVLDAYFFFLVDRLSGNGEIGLHETFSSLSIAPYEGQATSGTIVLGKPETLEASLSFKDPVSLEDERSVRKLLVCSSKECALISNGREVTGFGTTRQIGNNLCATVKFLGRGRWDVSINLPSPVRIAVNHGLPTMNSDALRKDAFAAALKATYGDVDSVQIQQIWLVVEQALSERVGCVVIVDAAAESEAARLATNAFPIAPAQLPDPGLSGIFGVDGAVLVDRQGVCHAFGVILDGTSRRGVGNRSRGARYNSVARYVDWRAGQAIGLVVSDDGGAEVLTAENAPAASQIR